MVLFVLASMVVAQAPSPAVQQTAFFCLIGEYDTKKKRMISEKPIRLNFLLTGHPLDVDGKPPLKTYDPAKLLAGESFNLFAKNYLPNQQGYSVMTQGLSSKSGHLLSMEPIPEKAGAYNALLGAKGLSGPEYLGQCFGPIAPIDEATFDQESKK